MRDPRGLGLATAVTLVAGVVVVLLAGCELLPAQPTAVPGVPAETPGPSELPLAPTVSAQAPPTPTIAIPPAPAMITLTIWTTEAFSPTQAITSGQILAAQVTSYEESHPDVRLKFVLKKPYGKGGILDFLLTTGAVVPALMPDLVLVDVDELDTAVQGNLIQPLDELVPAEIVADLYAFARDAATFDGQLYGLQLWADLDHLVYNTGKMTIPPRSWPGVLSNPGPYVFPAGGQAGLVNDAFLIQYLAVRPQPPATSADGPFLEQVSLAAVLQFYQDGLSRAVFPTGILNYHATDDCWRDYVAGNAALAQVSAHRYLVERDRVQTTAVAAIPSINGPAAALARGWALALVATDAARQIAATDFLVQVIEPEVNADWARSAGYLPTRQSSLANWDDTDSYTRFIQQQLQSARSRPLIANYAQVASALQDAVEAVLTGTASPEEAAAEAIASTQ
jgi:ABC-type glycerol-3-phosphate transport system substrate-binding protein